MRPLGLVLAERLVPPWPLPTALHSRPDNHLLTQPLSAHTLLLLLLPPHTYWLLSAERPWLAHAGRLSHAHTHVHYTKMDGSGGAVPWDSLIASGNLTTLLKAVVDRLDKQDKTIAKGFGGNLPDGAEGVDMDNVTLIDSDKLSQMMQRLDVLENTTLQNRIADPEGDKSLQSLVSDGQSKISLA